MSEPVTVSVRPEQAQHLQRALAALQQAQEAVVQNERAANLTLQALLVGAVLEPYLFQSVDLAAHTVTVLPIDPPEAP